MQGSFGREVYSGGAWGLCLVFGVGKKVSEHETKEKQEVQ